MKAWILRHTKATPPGTTEVWLKNRKINYGLTEFYQPEIHWPRLDDFDVLIICGGGMNVDQENKYPWLKQEKELIRKSLASGKKIVGLCLGGQLIAEALGARVGKHSQWEAGWHSVELFPQRTNLIPQGPTTLMAYQFHGYSFEIPKSCTPFARSIACENQGFIYNNQALAFQFHPEATDSWITECSKEKLPEGPFVQSPSEMIDGLRFRPALESWYFSVLDRFLL